MKNKQKGFVLPLLIGIIALLVIGGGIYVYESKKVETPIIDTKAVQVDQTQPVVTQNNASGWQTYSYTDSRNAFSFQYPSGWNLKDLKPTTSTGDHTVIIESPDSTTQKPITWQSVGLRSTTAQIAQFSNLTYNKPEKSMVTIGTISATEFNDNSIDGSWIIFEKNGYTYTVSSRNVDMASFEKFYGSLTFSK